MEKMNGKGYIRRGTPWLGDVEEALDKIGDRDFYRKTVR